MMRTRLQRHIHRCAARRSARLTQRMHFGMRRAGTLMPAFADHLTISHDDATDARMTAKKAEIDAKVSAYGAVKNTIDALRTKAKALGDASSLLTNTTTSSNPSAVSATATNAARAGVHTVEVSALARAHTIASRRFDDITSVVGSGTLTIRFGTTTFNQAGNYQEQSGQPAPLPPGQSGFHASIHRRIKSQAAANVR